MEENNLNNSEVTSEVTPETSVPEPTAVESSIPVSTEVTTDASFGPTPTSEEKKKVSPVVPIVIVVLLLALIGGGVWFFLRTATNSKKVLETTINDTFDKALDTFAEMKKMSFTLENKEVLKFDMDLKLSTNYPGFEEIGEYKFKGGVALDTMKNELSFNLGADRQSNELVMLNGLIKDKKIYLKSDKIFNGVLYSEFDMDDMDLSKIKFYSPDELTYVVNTAKKAFLAQIDEEKIGSEKVKKTINGKESEYLKTTYVFDGETQKKIEKAMTEALINDDKAVEIMAKIFGSDNAAVKSSLTEELENIDKYDVNNYKSYTLNVYTNKVGKMVALELIHDTTYIIDSTLSGDDYKTIIKDIDGTTVFDGIINEDKGLIEGKLYVPYDREYKQNYYVQDYTEVNFKMVAKDEKFHLEVSTTANNLEYGLKLDINMKDSKNETDSNIKAEIKVSGQGMDLTGTLESNSKISNNSSLDEFDISNAKHYSAMTQEEMMQIQTNLTNLIKGTMFEKLLMN